MYLYDELGTRFENLSVRSARALGRSFARLTLDQFIEKVAHMTDWELLEHRMVGPKVIEELREAIPYRGGMVNDGKVPLQFKALGQQGSPDLGGQIEVFERPTAITQVVLTCDEVTALCPVTSQPDLYTIIITYNPVLSCIESKSLKLYLFRLRNQGIFCEALAYKIAQDIYDATEAPQVQVQVNQKPRGGIRVQAIALLLDGQPQRPAETFRR